MDVDGQPAAGPDPRPEGPAEPDGVAVEPIAVVGAPTRAGRAVRAGLVAGRIVLTVTSVAVLTVVGLNWSTLRHLNQTIARTDVFAAAPSAPTVAPGLSQSPAPPPLTSDVNILVVGMDSRTDPHGDPLPANELALLNAGPNTGELNTDTMILIHIPAGGQKAVAISFPRDSYVRLAGGYGTHRLNSAFAYAHNAAVARLHDQGVTDAAGIEQQADTEGRKNLIATIENLLGNSITINRYAEINLVGFYQMSEALGGVRVCLNAATTDDQTHASFPAGMQTISGVQALNFVRQRHGLPRGDLDRIVRQQVFLGALANKILSAGTLTDPATMSALTGAIQSSVTLSTGWDVTSFAAQLQGLTSGAIQFDTIPTGANVRVTEGDVTMVDPARVRQFVDQLLGTAGPAGPSGSPGATPPPTTGVSSTPSTTTTTTTTTTAPVATTTPGSASGSASGSAPSGSGTGPISANGVRCVD